MDQEVDREVDKLFADAKWVEGIAPKLKKALDQVSTGQKGRKKREMILFWIEFWIKSITLTVRNLVLFRRKIDKLLEGLLPRY